MRVEQDGKREPPRVVVQSGVLRCPFCHDEVRTEKSVACRDCLARHHGTCWDEGGGKCAACRSTHKLVSLSGVAMAKPVRSGSSPTKLLLAQAALLLLDSVLAFASPGVAAFQGYLILLVIAVVAKRRGIEHRFGPVSHLNVTLLLFGLLVGLVGLLHPEVLLGYGLLVALLSLVLALLGR